MQIRFKGDKRIHLIEKTDKRHLRAVAQMANILADDCEVATGLWGMLCKFEDQIDEKTREYTPVKTDDGKMKVVGGDE